MLGSQVMSIPCLQKQCSSIERITVYVRMSFADQETLGSDVAPSSAEVAPRPRPRCGLLKIANLALTLQ